MATAEDAKLILQLYEMRREKVMRKARKFVLQEFFPQSVDDIKALFGSAAKVNHNAWFRQVTTYWDMAAAMVNHGALNPELFFETNGEHLAVWAKIGDFVPQLREEVFGPQYLLNLEKLVTSQPNGAARVEMFKARFKKMAETRATKGKHS